MNAVLFTILIGTVYSQYMSQTVGGSSMVPIGNGFYTLSSYLSTGSGVSFPGYFGPSLTSLPGYTYLYPQYSAPFSSYIYSYPSSGSNRVYPSHYRQFQWALPSSNRLRHPSSGYASSWNPQPSQRILPYSARRPSSYTGASIGAHGVNAGRIVQINRPTTARHRIIPSSSTTESIAVFETTTFTPETHAIFDKPEEPIHKPFGKPSDRTTVPPRTMDTEDQGFFRTGDLEPSRLEKIGKSKPGVLVEDDDDKKSGFEDYEDQVKADSHVNKNKNSKPPPHAEDHLNKMSEDFDTALEEDEKQINTKQEEGARSDQAMFSNENFNENVRTEFIPIGKDIDPTQQNFNGVRPQQNPWLRHKRPYGRFNEEFRRQ